MEKINNKYLDITLVIFFSLLIILSRPFVGIYIFGFRLGELLIGASLVMFFLLNFSLSLCLLKDKEI